MHILNCAHIKIVLAESGDSVTSIFFADIDSHSRLIFKVLVDELPVPCIFDMRNTVFFLSDSLFSELTLTWYQLDLDLELSLHKNCPYSELF